VHRQWSFAATATRTTVTAIFAEGVGLVLVTTNRGDRTELVEMARTADTPGAPGPSAGVGGPVRGNS
jgi:hypothetical protein